MKMIYSFYLQNMKIYSLNDQFAKMLSNIIILSIITHIFHL